MSYTSHHLGDTIVALATPAGVGAIGVVRLSGPQSIAIVDAVFRGKTLAQQPTHTAHFGTIRREDGTVVDEVLATLFVAPKSYTGENTVEVSCHGSQYIIQELIQLFIQEGARLAQPGEFTLRAFLNGRMDLSQAEAVADLIASDSAGSHQLALRQMRGGFSHEIAALRQELIDFASLIELELDFGEEDVEFANRPQLQALVHKIQGVLRQLIQSFQLGNVIKQGVTTVIAGRPNAGKSTLLNALLNEERAIVSEIAGTTRDTIEEVLNIKGIQFRLIDTAGIREAEDTIEALGVAKTLEKVRESSLLVYVFDVVNTSPAEVQADLAKLVLPGMCVLVVANKVDLTHPLPPPYEGGGVVDASQTHQQPVLGIEDSGASEMPIDHAQSSEAFGTSEMRQKPPLPQREGAGGWVHISAKTGINILHLKEKLYEAVLNEDVKTDHTIVSNARHYEALEKAYQALDAVMTGMQTGITSDFIAMDIRRALHHLGEITGEISTDDLLGNIFGRFCIGK